MSNEALKRVWTAQTSGGASHRLTLIALADMVNPSGFCWVSIDKLAEKVDVIKRRQLINVLAELEANGDISVLRRVKQQGRNGANYYVVNTGLQPDERDYALSAAEQHARANGWISAIDCTDNDAPDCTNNGELVQSSTDISAIQYQPNSAIQYRELVQPAAPHPSYDPMKSMNPEDPGEERESAPPPVPSDLAAWLKEHKIPHPKTAADLALIRSPAGRLWLNVTMRWPGWVALREIVKSLGPQPDEPALRETWRIWDMNSYSPRNIAGILERYHTEIGRAGSPRVGPPSANGHVTATAVEQAKARFAAALEEK